MSVLISFALFHTVNDNLFWDLPGDVLAAPASALCGWYQKEEELRCFRPGESGAMSPLSPPQGN